MIQFANYAYQGHLDGTDNGINPAWFTEARSKLASGELLDQVVTVVGNDLLSAPSDSKNLLVKVLFGGTKNKALSKVGEDLGPVILGQAKDLAPDVADTLNKFLVDLVDSFTNDTNYPHDLSFSIYEKNRKDGTMRDDESAKPAGAEMTALNSLVSAAMTAANAGL